MDIGHVADVEKTVRMRKHVLFLIGFWLVAWSAFAQERPWMNEKLSVEERVELLIHVMTTEEKLSQLLDESPAIERLGILPYNWWNEALHGVARSGRATVFPQAIGMAATFDEQLLFRVASAISDEARAKFNIAQANQNYSKYAGLTFWTPNINIFRDPRWGRGQETYGEDPYLTSRLGLAFVRGLQGDNPRYLKTAACAKHFAVHSGPEALRHEFNAAPPRSDLYETYLPAFETLVREGKVEAVMGAYNRVYGEPACGSAFLLDTLLRQRWGFKGHIVSDCGAIDDIYKTHKSVSTSDSAAAMAALAGVNLNCGCTYKSLDEALGKKMIQEETVNNLIRPLLATRFKLGLFDKKSHNPYNSIGSEVIESAAHKALAREVAAKSFVLLKNANGVLPLRKDIRSIYVTGPFAADASILLGNYYGLSSSLSTILEGITSKVSLDTRIDYKPGTLLNQFDVNPINWAGGEAHNADAIVAVLGISGMLEGEEGESIASPYKGDRLDLNLPENQVHYLRALRNKYKKPLIVIITSGSPVTLSEVDSLADAVLFVWYPGQEGGNAVADVLFGDVSPSGRLPVTFPMSVSQLPPYEDYSMQGRTYKYMTESPLYPFGYGLSYTTFAYSESRLREAEGKLELSLDVKNTGNREGDEMVQLYLVKPGAGKTAPLRSLAGVKRVSLKPGETKRVTMFLPFESMASVNDRGDKLLVKGEYSLILSAAAPVERSLELGATNRLELKYTVK
jgi:beta-glucosidase